VIDRAGPFRGGAGVGVFFTDPVDIPDRLCQKLFLTSALAFRRIRRMMTA
jgi:hypothetical protein